MERRDLRGAIASAIAVAAAGVAWLAGRARLERAASSVVDLWRRAAGQWQARPGRRGRYLRGLGSEPLPNLYEVHPEARQATPREIGLRSIDVDEIAGTAVGGATQRGADFKPLPAFRSQNWAARWQRIRRAVDQLAILPPIDVVRYPPGGRYWVLDGHNRVAAALDVGQVGIDANVTELVPPGQNPSERPADLAAALAGTRSLRSAAQGSPLRTVQDDVVFGVPTPDGQPPAGAEPARPDPVPAPEAADAPGPTEPAPER
jgi:hypothetical protein